MRGVRQTLPSWPVPAARHQIQRRALSCASPQRHNISAHNQGHGCQEPNLLVGPGDRSPWSFWLYDSPLLELQKVGPVPGWRLVRCPASVRHDGWLLRYYYCKSNKACAWRLLQHFDQQRLENVLPNARQQGFRTQACWRRQGSNDVHAEIRVLYFGKQLYFWRPSSRLSLLAQNDPSIYRGFTLKNGWRHSRGSKWPKVLDFYFTWHEYF